jgi:hypothetical protein
MHKMNVKMLNYTVTVVFTFKIIGCHTYHSQRVSQASSRAYCLLFNLLFWCEGGCSSYLTKRWWIFTRPHCFTSQKVVTTVKAWNLTGIFIYVTAFRPALRPTQPPIQWLPGVLSLGIKQPWPEADHLMLKLRRCGDHISISPYIFMV